MRKTLLTCIFVSFALVACGDDEGGGDDTQDIDANAGIDSGDDIDGNGGTPTCAAYCTTIQANCTGENAQYTSEQSCLDTCAAFTVGASGDTSGNTLGCREYHAGAAAGDPGLHCVHAGPGGAGACGANCEGFCTVVLHACTGADEVYADMATCMTECGGFTDDDPYDISDVNGDNLACRLYHAVTAVTTPTPHCTHVDENSPTCQ